MKSCSEKAVPGLQECSLEERVGFYPSTMILQIWEEFMRVELVSLSCGETEPC